MKEYEFKKDFVYKRLRDSIFSGIYPPDFKLPKERDLSKQLDVAVITLRDALKRLEEEKLIIRLPSKGTFVLPKTDDKKTAKTLLVITSEMAKLENPTAYILAGVMEEAAMLGMKITNCDLAYINSISSEHFSDIIAEKNISGVLAFMGNFRGDEPIIEKLKALKVPVVFPHSSAKDFELTGLPTIVFPQKEAWRDAVKYLADQGYKRIATFALGSHYRGFSESEHLELLKNYGFSTEKELLCNVQYDACSIASEVNRIMNIAGRPEAILCFSDFVALHVYGALAKLKLRIPDDVAVMGYCGYPGSAFLEPPLSTVDFQYEDMGRIAVKFVVQLESAEGACHKKIAQYKLVPRESTRKV